MSPWGDSLAPIGSRESEGTISGSLSLLGLRFMLSCCFSCLHASSSLSFSLATATRMSASTAPSSDSCLASVASCAVMVATSALVRFQDL